MNTGISSKPEDYLGMAVQLALENVQVKKERPFGAVLVKNGEIVATGVNTVLSTHDPTAHAELQAIQAGSRKLQNAQLDGHIMYASGHPCPMCLAAMYLAGIREVYYAYSNEDGESFGLSTRELYAELAKPLSAQAMKLEYRPVRLQGEEPYEVWKRINSAT